MMYYTDLKSALSPLTGTISWPANPPAQTGISIVSGATPISEIPSITLADLQTAISGYLSATFFADLIKTLPTELTNIISIDGQLEIAELSIATSTPANGGMQISGFNIALSYSFTKPVSFAGLSLDSIGLKIYFVPIGEQLVWRPVLEASTTFLGVECDVSISLMSLSITLLITEPEDGDLQTILSSTGSGTSISSLMGDMNITNAGDAPTLVHFIASADISASPQFFVSLTLATSGLTWRGLALENVTIAIADSLGQPSFSLSVQAMIGNCPVQGSMTSDNGTTQFEGSVSIMGTTLTDFLDIFGSEGQANFTNPLPSLPDISLSGIMLSLNDSGGIFNFNMSCGGSIVFDELGTSLMFDFVFARESGGDVLATLTIDNIVLSLTSTPGTVTFSYEGSESVSFESLARLAQISALYGIASDISLTVTKAMLVFAPPASATASGHHILAAIEFDIDTTIEDPLLTMITGQSSFDFDGLVFSAANAPWTMTQLGSIAANAPITFSSPLAAGIGLQSTFQIAGNTVSAPLTSASTNNSTSYATPSPQPVQASSATRWFNVQKQAGPVYIDRVGISLNTDPAEMGLLVDGAFSFGPLTMSLVQLGITIPFTSSSSFSTSLAGINIGYNNPPLTISGGILDTGGNLFDGDLVIESSALSLAAIGQYADQDNFTSLSLFAALTDPPIGGPVFCFIDGLAAGGGYNSHLQQPTTPAAVVNFPLLQAASGSLSLQDPFAVINACITPQQGANWLAVGILFRSFELLQSTALLTASFGNQLQFSILGQSEMSIPPASGERLAYAQVDIDATYDPAADTLEVYGILTQNSYVLSPDCHIQGGFAFIMKSNGDFVVTYGGYSPHFNATGYPSVPRLSMLWNVDSHTQIKGDEYFAITPALMMAGGGIQATWDCGIFSAWFSVNADIVIQWCPFYYEADFSMSLGVEFDLKVLFINIHFTFHVGAALNIAGPPFHGTAHIDLSVISFTVSFGPGNDAPQSLSWEQFREILPGLAANDTGKSALLSAKVTNGLRRDLTQNKSTTPPTALAATQTNPDWVVNRTSFEFTLQSSMPITSLSNTGGVNSVAALPPVAATIGILPMAISSAEGHFSVTITNQSTGKSITAGTDPSSNVVAELINTQMSSAHWGTSQPQDSNTAPIACTSGYKIYGGKPVSAHTPYIPLSILLSDCITVQAISDRPASFNPF